MANVDLGKILAILTTHDDPSGNGCRPDPETMGPLREALNGHFCAQRQVQAVLGIDIYQYSRHPSEAQRLVPSVFQFLHTAARSLCAEREAFLFQADDLNTSFIHTGDGGFQILSTPLQALVFAIYFETLLASFNGFFVFPKVRQVVGPISLRYSITYDEIIPQDGNWFGSAIINNARILARDNLNRLLVDGRSIEWFQEQTVNVETLMAMSMADIRKVPAFRDYEPRESAKSMVFGDSPYLLDRAVRSVHVQKIGIVASKQTTLDVYNVQLQVAIQRSPGLPAERIMVVTVGNLNPTGISA